MDAHSNRSQISVAAWELLQYIKRRSTTRAWEAGNCSHVYQNTRTSGNFALVLRQWFIAGVSFAFREPSGSVYRPFTCRCKG